MINPSVALLRVHAADMSVDIDLSAPVVRDVPIQASASGRLDCCVAKRSLDGPPADWQRSKLSTPRGRKSR
jgi:hypothetical protein